MTSCDASFSPPKSFIDTTNIEALNASLEKVLVSNTVAKVCCNTSGENIVYEYGTSSDLTGSPFTLSDVQNRFTVLGCNSQADISNYDFASRCTSCWSAMVNGSCNGSGCCQSTIPKGVKYYKITVPTMQLCFLADEDNFNFSVTDFLGPNFIDKARSVPVVLDWAAGTETCEEAQKDTANFACRGNSICTDATNGRCSCFSGFHGNPCPLKDAKVKGTA